MTRKNKARVLRRERACAVQSRARAVLLAQRQWGESVTAVMLAWWREAYGTLGPIPPAVAEVFVRCGSVHACHTGPTWEQALVLQQAVPSTADWISAVMYVLPSVRPHVINLLLYAFCLRRDPINDASASLMHTLMVPHLHRSLQHSAVPKRAG